MRCTLALADWCKKHSRRLAGGTGPFAALALLEISADIPRPAALRLAPSRSAIHPRAFCTSLLVLIGAGACGDGSASSLSLGPRPEPAKHDSGTSPTRDGGEPERPTASLPDPDEDAGADLPEVPDFDSGLDPLTSLAALDVNQVGQLCDAGSEYLDQVVTRELLEEASCTLIALLLLGESSDAAECGVLHRDCIENGEAVEGQEGFSCDLTPELAASCQAPVETFERCTSELAALSLLLFDSLRCELLFEDPASVEAAMTSMPDVSLESPACTTLQAQCPELFNDGVGGL